MNFKLLDLQVIELLQQDARVPRSRVAQLTGYPEPTVRQRIKRVTASRVMKPVAVVNPEAFNYSMVVDIFCQVAPTQQDQVLSALT